MSAVAYQSYRVAEFIAAFCYPVKMIEPVVVLLVNKRESAFAQWDSAKREAVFDSTKQKDRQSKNIINPVRTFNSNSSHYLTLSLFEP